MMQISVKTNIKEVTRELGRVSKKYVPNATRNAINETLFGLRKALPQEMRSVFDEPVSFTTSPSAWYVDKADKTNLCGELKLKRAQAGYLKFQVHGGTQLPRRSAIPVPLPKARAAHGGLRRTWKTMLQKPHHFSGKPRGQSGARPGIYKRLGATKKKPAGKGLLMVISWQEKTEYQKQFHFYEFAQRYVRRNFSKHFREKLRWYVKNRG